MARVMSLSRSRSGLLFHGLFLGGLEELYRSTRHDRRNGMLVDQLDVTIAAQQNTEVIKPTDDALKLYAVYEEHRDWKLVFADMIEKDVLYIL